MNRSARFHAPGGIDRWHPRTRNRGALETCLSALNLPSPGPKSTRNVEERPQAQLSVCAGQTAFSAIDDERLEPSDSFRFNV